MSAQAWAQGTNVTLGGLNADPTAPVEVTADSLSVDQENGTAVFSGNVVIGQGDVRISAAEVRVVYGEDTGEIARLVATGGVTFVTATEAAEAANADYDIANGQLTLTGNVLLTQGASALAAERMVVDLTNGTARMDGRVRTVFQQQNGGN
ncbi:lipopolysaccharide transport periplasmic protein LptA [Loktanella sp. IMCC34160]|uniref:lipopolysaccharide transport periplasmic protein LptA n=1 Tax=Loktanella sp. IMCC34160 TaxID=2510646 RepID=UPI001F5CA9AB|nr:lipopolysaccharide transport periplasmic protein LptA [Loktanella sp. IMCC34160]